MPPVFRYRYVDIGTVFTGDSGQRDARNGADCPATLFSNELACDVGGTLWAPNEPLAVIDHPVLVQYPSASAAVLSNANLIRNKFSPSPEIVWLVTHYEPDFDAFCAMYLARWIIEDSAATADWILPNIRERSLEGRSLDFSDVPQELRWAPLLAMYATAVETRQPISCPRARTLRSILLAAMKRGRGYLGPTSGATEFFDEVRNTVGRSLLTPQFDSVLEGNVHFTPELTMLDHESAAYERDLARARKSIVYLPESEAPTPDFFEHPKRASLEEFTDADSLLAETFRTPSDGIYLRDPECALFEEWARGDIQNSAFGKGFEFIALAYSGARPAGTANTSRYVFSIDAEHARGRHLYTVWSRLQIAEMEASRTLRRPTAMGPVLVVGQRAGAAHELLSDRWIGGHSRSSTLVDTPPDGSAIGAPGKRGDLQDDPVAEAVRTELENAMYVVSSGITGPQVTTWDLAADGDVADPTELTFDLNEPSRISCPEARHFRFAKVDLRPDISIATDGLLGQRMQAQIAATLWRVLYPGETGGTSDLECHLVVTPESVGVWSDRGIAIARKRGADADQLELGDFSATVSLIRDLRMLSAETTLLERDAKAQHDDPARSPHVTGATPLAARTQELTRRALDVQRVAALPEYELLRRFHDGIGMEKLIARLHDFNHVATEHLQREIDAEEARRADRRAEDVARARARVRWLEVFAVGFVALEAVAIILRNINFDPRSESTLALFGGPITLALAAWILRPWRRKRPAGQLPTATFKWVMVAVSVVWFAAWLLQVFRLW
jgi:hypothetical protein